MTAGAASASAQQFPYFNPFNETPTALSSGGFTIEGNYLLVPLKCSSMSGTYVPENQHEGPANITLKGCAEGAEFGGPACTTSGFSAGEINAKIRLLLSYLSKEKHEAAIVLNYHKTEELAIFAKFSCGSNSYNLRGSVVSKITPVNTFSGNYELILKSSANKQEFTKYQIETGTGGVEEFTAKLRLGFKEEVGAAASLSALALKFTNGGLGGELVA
jgi:hypothetical protein